MNVSGSTIYRTRRRFVEGNLAGALSEEAPSIGPRRETSFSSAFLLPDQTAGCVAVALTAN